MTQGECFVCGEPTVRAPEPEHGAVCEHCWNDERAVIIEVDGTVRVEPIGDALVELVGLLQVLDLPDLDCRAYRVEDPGAAVNSVATSVWRMMSMTSRVCVPGVDLRGPLVVLSRAPGAGTAGPLTDQQIRELVEACTLHRELMA